MVALLAFFLQESWRYRPQAVWPLGVGTAAACLIVTGLTLAGLCRPMTAAADLLTALIFLCALRRAGG